MRTPICARALCGAALLGCLVCLFSQPARACSICLAGDPSYSGSGASVLEPGRLSLYTEFRSWQKISGELHEPDGTPPPPGAFEKNQGQRLDFYASYAPVDRLTLGLNVPVLFNEIQEIDPPDVLRLRRDGPGDISLLASFSLWRDREVLPATWLEGRALLKFPTAESRDFEEAQGDPHLQLGTGSWDFGFGLAAAHKLPFAVLYASAFYRENTPGSLGYLYGDVVLGTAAAELPLGHASGIPALDALVPGFALDFRYSERDHFEGLTYVDSGGSILYATPSLRIRIPWLRPARPPSLRLAVQIPLVQSWLYGFQQEGRVWSAGLLVPF